jgi:NHS family xanthosine MFS transporter
MNIKFRLLAMNFLEFFVWGAWLMSLGAYAANTLHFSGVQTASIFGTMAIASLFMPALLGVVADRWLNAERVLGLCHLAGAGLLHRSRRKLDLRDNLELAIAGQSPRSQ